MHKNTERGFNMDTTKKLEMLKRLDDIYEAALKNDDKAKVQDVIKPYLGEFAKEYDVDMTTFCSNRIYASGFSMPKTSRNRLSQKD